MPSLSKIVSAVIVGSFTAQTAAFAPITTNITPKHNTQLQATTVQLAEGLTKSITKEGNGVPLRLGDVATVSYNCYEAATKKAFSRSNKQKVVVGDGIMIDGWDRALATMKVGEKAIVSITDAEKFGYGAAGVSPVIPPNAALEIEIEIFEAEEQKNLGVAGVAGITGMTGSGDLGNLDPNKPRTPEAIAAAYKVRQGQMEIEKANEKQGLEGMIEKAKEFYFFGFFEGETGEKTPWILRPSITFPIAFAVVGAGFYVTFALGGISERGAQVTDELDDIILSYNMVKSALVIAFAQMSL